MPQRIALYKSYLLLLLLLLLLSLAFPYFSRGDVCAVPAGPHDLAAGRGAGGPVPAVVAVHATTPGAAPGSRPRPAASGSPAPDGQRPPGPVPGVAASARGRVQHVHGRLAGRGAQRISRHQGSPRQVR